MLARVLSAFEQLGRAWCKVMHPDPTWPVNGYYRCPRCHRKYRVPWEPLRVTPGAFSGGERQQAAPEQTETVPAAGRPPAGASPAVQGSLALQPHA